MNKHRYKRRSRICLTMKHSVDRHSDRVGVCTRLWNDVSIHRAGLLGYSERKFLSGGVAHIPALLWNQNRVYGLIWDAVVATNEDVAVADYDFVAVWTLCCMYKPYWLCGSKGYLVHKAHIPPAMEFKVAYMAKFGVPSVPQTRGVPMADYDFMAVWILFCM